jgi:HD superfamily phosphodiesterase
MVLRGRLGGEEVGVHMELYKLAAYLHDLQRGVHTHTNTPHLVIT